LISHQDSIRSGATRPSARRAQRLFLPRAFGPFGKRVPGINSRRCHWL